MDLVNLPERERLIAERAIVIYRIMEETALEPSESEFLSALDAILHVEGLQLFHLMLTTVLSARREAQKYGLCPGLPPQAQQADQADHPAQGAGEHRASGGKSSALRQSGLSGDTGASRPVARKGQAPPNRAGPANHERGADGMGARGGRRRAAGVVPPSSPR